MDALSTGASSRKRPRCAFKRGRPRDRFGFDMFRSFCWDADRIYVAQQTKRKRLMFANDPIPVWNWYQPKGDPRPEYRVRALYMDAPFSYTNSAGVFRIPGGNWLIEDAEGQFPRSMGDWDFRNLYERVEEARAERTDPHQPQPEPDAPAPDSTVLQ
jgi:hypothetical protein